MTATTGYIVDYTPGFDFEGWWLSSTTDGARLDTLATPVICPKGGLFTAGYVDSDGYTYGACSYSTDDAAYYYTSCADATTLLYDDSSPMFCNDGYSCGYYAVLPTPLASDVDTTWVYDCLAEWMTTDTIYASLPLGYQTISSISATTSSSVAEQFSHTSSHTSARTSTRTSAHTGTKYVSRPSGGAIAGIVVGCVAGAAIIALILIFRKRILACFGNRKHPEVDDTPGWAPVPPQAESATYTDDMLQPSELPSEQNAFHEMESSKGNMVQEIGTSDPNAKPEKIFHEIG